LIFLVKFKGFFIFFPRLIKNTVRLDIPVAAIRALGLGKIP
jgi:hypothetical protein